MRGLKEGMAGDVEACNTQQKQDAEKGPDH